MEDRQIIQLFWDRATGAIPAAQERYGGRLLGLAERLLGNREDAEECVNDTWLNAWNAIPPERPVFLFTYLARCAAIWRLVSWTGKAPKRETRTW